ncbi:hypothetical protein ACWCP6_30275 [Streptomyces sp. NPDC002004]
MAVPEVIPIAHEPDHRTETIGRYADGQFLASLTYAFPEGYRPDDGWEEHKRLYAILHTFDADGRHRDSEIWCAGTWADQQRNPHGDGSVLARAGTHLAKLLAGLPGLTYTDIAIRPFQVTVDGVRFGLVTEHAYEDGADGDDGDWAELYPERLGFGAPWDGRYDT